MIKVQYSKDIKASSEKVYRTMLGLDNIKTYEQWTALFNPTSSYEGSWEKGRKIYFTATDQNGKKGGLVSEIAENEPGKFVSIRHIGLLDGDKEITEGSDVEEWAGGLENYAFSENNGITTVTIETNIDEKHQSFFDDIWPKSLDILQQLSES